MSRILGFLVAALLISEDSFATRARVTSLQGADHLMDEQTVFQYPARIHSISPMLIFEMGAPAGGDAAEGGLVKKTQDGKLMVYLGRDVLRPDATGADARSGYLDQQNPLDIVYGKNDWALGATLSMVDNKKSKTKEQTLILRYGKNLKDAEFFVSADVISTAQKANDDKVTAAPYLMIGGSKDSGDYHFFGQFQYGDGKVDIATPSSTTKVKDMNFQAGFEDRSMRSSGSDLYYGALLKHMQRDYEGKKVTGTALPIFIGVEYDVNSWAVLRASIQQNFLIGSVKNENVGAGVSTDADGITDNTTVSGGLGLKYNKLQLDGTLAASSTGDINGNAFLAQAGLIYFY